MGINYGPKLYYNKATLEKMDSLISTDRNGNVGFAGCLSRLYYEIIGATSYKFSSADNEILEKEALISEAERQRVIRHC